MHTEVRLVELKQKRCLVGHITYRSGFIYPAIKPIFFNPESLQAVGLRAQLFMMVQEHKLVEDQQPLRRLYKPSRNLRDLSTLHWGWNRYIDRRSCPTCESGCAHAVRSQCTSFTTIAEIVAEILRHQPPCDPDHFWRISALAAAEVDTASPALAQVQQEGQFRPIIPIGVPFQLYS